MKRIGKLIVQHILAIFSRAILVVHRPLVIAITGSTDKTTVKDAIVERFRAHDHCVRANPRSYNTEIGLPLAILGLPSGQRSPLLWIAILLRGLRTMLFDRAFPPILIVELGVDHPGDMDYLLSIVHPTVGVITNVTSQYICHFGDLDRIASEYGRLLYSLPAKGLAIINADDHRLESFATDLKGIIVTLGEERQGMHRIKDVATTESGQSWLVEHSGASQSSTNLTSIRFGSHHRFAESVAFLIHEWYDHTITSDKNL